MADPTVTAPYPANTPHRRLPGWLKALLITLGVLVGLVLLLAILVPLLFKDTIREKVQLAVNENVNADVRFADLDLSLLRRFPNLTITLEGLRVVGRDEFAADTLVSAREIDVAVDVFSVIGGERIGVRYVGLTEPRLHLLVLRNGKANWDIAKADTAATPADTAPSEPFRLELDRYEITDGYIVYDDRSLPFYTRLEGVQHSGSGDFTAEVFDLETETDIRRVRVDFDSVNYVNGLRFRADAGFHIDLAQSKYTLRDNRFIFNELPLTLDGWVGLPDSVRTTMDLKFAAAEADFKQLLSLVPGMYNEHFARLRAEGRLAFAGSAQGTYSPTEYPKFDFRLQVADGQFQYEGLPDAVKNVQVDATVRNRAAVLDSVELDLKRLALQFGPNPVEAQLRTKGLEPIRLEGFVKGKLDLGYLTKLFPLEGYTLRGLLAVDARANGTYGPRQMPVLQAALDLRDGYLKTAQYPQAALQNIAVNLNAKGEGSMASTQVAVPRFHFEVGNEPVDGRLLVDNLDDPAYDLAVKGRLDLAQLTKIYPLEGMELAGIVVADVATQGRVSDVQAERYQKLSARGNATVQNLLYRTAGQPEVRVDAARLDFTPQSILLSDTRGRIGSSDYAVEGSVSNYMPYLFQENETIQGAMTLRSRRFNLNEFMTSGPAPADTAASQPMEVILIPKNVDFLFRSTIGEVVYEKLMLRDLQGGIQVKDQTVRLVDVTWNILGGAFAASGSYSTRNPDAPHVNFDFQMRDVQIAQAFQTFTTIQALAPVAQYAQGKFNTQLQLSTDLLRNMMPNLKSLTANGVATILNAAIKDMPVLERLAAVSNLNALQNPELRDTKLKLRINDGRLHVEPFDVNVGSYTMTVAGSNGLDKTIDYRVAVQVPAGQVGQVASNLLRKVPGLNVAKPEKVALAFRLQGPFSSPAVTPAGVQLLGGDGGEQQSVAAQVTEQVRETLRDTLDATQQRLREAAEARAREEADKVRAEAEKARQEAEARARQEADRLKKQAADKLRERLPFGRKPAPSDTSKN